MLSVFSIVINFFTHIIPFLASLALNTEIVLCRQDIIHVILKKQIQTIMRFTASGAGKFDKKW